jgi:hypothetical protein
MNYDDCLNEYSKVIDRQGIIVLQNHIKMLLYTRRILGLA